MLVRVHRWVMGSVNTKSAQIRLGRYVGTDREPGVLRSVPYVDKSMGFTTPTRTVVDAACSRPRAVSRGPSDGENVDGRRSSVGQEQPGRERPDKTSRLSLQERLLPGQTGATMNVSNHRTPRRAAVKGGTRALHTDPTGSRVAAGRSQGRSWRVRPVPAPCISPTDRSSQLES